MALKRLEKRTNQKVKPPQAPVFNPERNELKNRFVGSRCPERLQRDHHPDPGSKRKFR